MNSLDNFGAICGWTPLIKISEKIYAKLETYNPTGSVKDRMVWYVINKALRAGKINDETILCEATSGNTGIALSSIAASLGLECSVFMPRNMSEERKQMMSVYGATFVDAPPDDFDRAIEMRNEFLASNSAAWSPLQFSNPDNIECHQMITAPEIKMQTLDFGLEWSVFIHGSGTGGTIEGVRRYLSDTTTKTYMVIPKESSHGIQGIGDGRDFLANPNDMDGTITVATQDAIARAQKFAEDTGILVGISSGANIWAAENYVETHDIDGVVITMLCDRGERYLSLYNGNAK